MNRPDTSRPRQSDCRGAINLEYLLLCAVVALGVVAGLTVFSERLSAAADTVARRLLGHTSGSRVESTGVQSHAEQGQTVTRVEGPADPLGHVDFGGLSPEAAAALRTALLNGTSISSDRYLPKTWQERLIARGIPADALINAQTTRRVCAEGEHHKTHNCRKPLVFPDGSVARPPEPTPEEPTPAEPTPEEPTSMVTEFQTHVDITQENTSAVPAQIVSALVELGIYPSGIGPQDSLDIKLVIDGKELLLRAPLNANGKVATVTYSDGTTALLVDSGAELSGFADGSVVKEKLILLKLGDGEAPVEGLEPGQVVLLQYGKREGSAASKRTGGAAENVADAQWARLPGGRLVDPASTDLLWQRYGGVSADTPDTDTPAAPDPSRGVDLSPQPSPFAAFLEEASAAVNHTPDLDNWDAATGGLHTAGQILRGLAQLNFRQRDVTARAGGETHLVLNGHERTVTFGKQFLAPEPIVYTATESDGAKLLVLELGLPLTVGNTAVPDNRQVFVELPEGQGDFEGSTHLVLWSQGGGELAKQSKGVAVGSTALAARRGIRINGTGASPLEGDDLAKAFDLYGKTERPAE